MKVKIGKYKNRWITTSKLYDKLEGKISQERLDKIDDVLTDILYYCWNRPLEKLGLLGSQKIKVRIDPYDTWNMDHTLSYIIVPMLEQLKTKKQGVPHVDLEDVPEELRITVETNEDYPPSNEEHDLWVKRWEYVLDEMLWAFKEIRDEYPNEPEWNRFLAADKDSEYRKYHARIVNGTTLFGKYYQALWD